MNQTACNAKQPAHHLGTTQYMTVHSYYRARYYHPQFQRFISEDPLGLTRGINLFRYVHNSPVNYKDPSGKGESPWHFFETFDAARQSGMSFLDSLNLATQAVEADFLSGSQGNDAEHTNWHAMSGRKPNGQQQTCDQARQGTIDWIQNARSVGNNAGALHAIQDSWFVSHQFQAWNGVDGSYPSHLFHDVFPTPTVVGDGLEASTVFLTDPNVDPSTLVPACH